MGIEYRLTLGSKNDTQIDSFLRSFPCFSHFDETSNRYSYRDESNTGKMPNAEVKIEATGLYLCDYGMSKDLFGLLLARLVSLCGSVQIEDYEP